MKNALTRIWTRRIDSYQVGMPIEKAKIGAFRKLISRPNYLPAIQPELQTKLDSLWDFGNSRFAWAITLEQTEQGLSWLKIPKIRKQLSEKHRAILDDFSHFLFVDVQDLSTCHRQDSAPVYRVCSYTQGWFDYVPRPWQAQGCPFEIARES